jgi:ketosteroid isomerase-like protein
VAGGARSVIERYHDAWKNHDYEHARALLHDDLSFRGPFDTFERADDFIETIKGLAPIVEDVHVRRRFADGDDVCLIFDMVTAGAGTRPIAEWYSVRGGRIASLRVIFDARPFAALLEGRG